MVFHEIEREEKKGKRPNDERTTMKQRESMRMHTCPLLSPEKFWPPKISLSANTSPPRAKPCFPTQHSRLFPPANNLASTTAVSTPHHACSLTATAPPLRRELELCAKRKRLLQPPPLRLISSPPQKNRAQPEVSSLRPNRAPPRGCEFPSLRAPLGWPRGPRS